MKYTFSYRYIDLDIYRNCSSCIEFAPSSNRTRVLTRQSVRASGSNSVVVSSNFTQDNFR